MEAFVPVLTALGLPGLLLAASGVTIKRLFDLYTQSQEKRIEEAGKYQTAVAEFTATLKAYTEALKKGGV